MKHFYKKLLSFLTHKSQKLEIFALSIITSLCLYDDIGQQVGFVLQIVHQTYSLSYGLYFYKLIQLNLSVGATLNLCSTKTAQPAQVAPLRRSLPSSP